MYVYIIIYFYCLDDSHATRTIYIVESLERENIFLITILEVYAVLKINDKMNAVLISTFGKI